jgi:hypothetical protein
VGKCKHVEKQQHVEKEPMKSFLQKGRGGNAKYDETGELEEEKPGTV